MDDESDQEEMRMKGKREVYLERQQSIAAAAVNTYNRMVSRSTTMCYSTT